MKNLILIILCIIVLGSCGKKRTITIIAKNAATGLPYSGLSYKIVSSRTAANGEKYRTEESGTLNANGEASITMKRKTGRTYSVRVIEPTNTCYNKQITQFFDSPYDVNGTFTFEFAECAYLRQNIVNANCQGPLDELLFKDKYLYSEWSEATILGCFTNTGGDYFKVPEGTRLFYWKVTRSGAISEGYDTIVFNAGEYKEFNLNY